MAQPFDLLESEEIPLDECCICLSESDVRVVRVGEESFPFCGTHEERSLLLECGKAYGWPALKHPPYAIGHRAFEWVFTAIQGTNERVTSLLDALNEFEQNQLKSA